MKDYLIMVITMHYCHLNLQKSWLDRLLLACYTKNIFYVRFLLPNMYKPNLIIEQCFSCNKNMLESQYMQK